MCAEAVPWRCRQSRGRDALLVRKIGFINIRDPWKGETTLTHAIRELEDEKLYIRLRGLPVPVGLSARFRKLSNGEPCCCSELQEGVICAVVEARK